MSVGHGEEIEEEASFDKVEGLIVVKFPEAVDDIDIRHSVLFLRGLINMSQRNTNHHTNRPYPLTKARTAATLPGYGQENRSYFNCLLQKR